MNRNVTKPKSHRSKWSQEQNLHEIKHKKIFYMLQKATRQVKIENNDRNRIENHSSVESLITFCLVSFPDRGVDSRQNRFNIIFARIRE